MPIGFMSEFDENKIPLHIQNRSIEFPSEPSLKLDSTVLTGSLTSSIDKPAYTGFAREYETVYVGNAAGQAKIEFSVLANSSKAVELKNRVLSGRGKIAGGAVINGLSDGSAIKLAGEVNITLAQLSFNEDSVEWTFGLEGMILYKEVSVVSTAADFLGLMTPL